MLTFKKILSNLRRIKLRFRNIITLAIHVFELLRVGRLSKMSLKLLNCLFRNPSPHRKHNSPRCCVSRLSRGRRRKDRRFINYEKYVDIMHRFFFLQFAISCKFFLNHITIFLTKFQN